jgi:uncharacterized protein
MTLLQELFGKSPFAALVKHAKKVHECVKLVCPLMEAAIAGDYQKIHTLQDEVSKKEYEADIIKHEIRDHLPRRYFLPVDRKELESFLRIQDQIADKAEDFAVVLYLRQTPIHPLLKEDFLEFAKAVVDVSNTLLAAGRELNNLVETTFSGFQAESVMKHISGIGEAEWKVDRMQRKICKKIYGIEDELSPVTISFYDKMLTNLSGIANATENTGDELRTMIIKR